MTRRARTVRTNLVHRPTLVERRDPTAATQQLQFISPGMPQVPNFNPRRAVNQAYLASFVVARCVQIRARDLAALPFLTGPRLPVSPTDLPAVTPGSPLARLAAAPAPELTWEKLIAWLATQWIVTGKMGAEIEWAGTPAKGAPVALWPLVSAELRPIESKGGNRWFDRFEYGRPDAPKRLSPDEILYDWNPAPDNFRQPYSVLQSAALDVSVAVMVGRYNYAFLRNDARPAAVVVTEKFATGDDFDAFADQFEGRHQGVDNAGRVAFLEAEGGDGDVAKSVHIETLGISQKDARMLEMHRASLEHVAMALGVPWSRLSAADRTFSNADAEDQWYWESTLLPDVRALQAAINAQVAPKLGPDVGWFDLSSVRALQPRPPVDAGGAAVLVGAGIAGVEEVRPWFGLAGPGPDLPELPAGGQDGPDAPALPAPGDPGGADGGDRGIPSGDGRVSGDVHGRPGDVHGRPGHDHGGRDAGAGVGGPDRRALTVEDQAARRATIWRTVDATIRSLEATWVKQWRRLFNDQADAVTKAITRSRAKQVRAASTAREIRADLGVFDSAYWRARTEALAEAMYEAAVTHGVARINSDFGVSFDLEAPFVRGFIAARANQLAGQVTSSTYAAIQSALADGVANGASIDDLATAVQDVFDVASRSRAKTIARTEVISASNGSASLAAAQLPPDVVAGAEWISTADDRTRDDHVDADGQVVPVGTPFTVGGEQLAYPGDPSGSADNVINCRCTVAHLTPADYEATGRSRQVSLNLATYAVRALRPGDFDSAEFRRSLLAVA